MVDSEAIERQLNGLRKALLEVVFVFRVSIPPCRFALSSSLSFLDTLSLALCVPRWTRLFPVWGGPVSQCLFTPYLCVSCWLSVCLEFQMAV